MLVIENQNKNCIFIISDNCKINLDKGTSIYRIHIAIPATTGSEELARYSSYDKAKQAYRDLLNYLTTDKQFRPCSFTLPEDTN